MEKIPLTIWTITSSVAQTGAFTLILSENSYPNRRLPIVIGVFEAQAIAIEIEKIKPSRPFTHDLFKKIVDNMEGSVVEVVISNLNEGTFYADIVCMKDFRTFTIDARPSDAVAIAVRFKVPIYTYEFILEQAAILPEEEKDTVQPKNSAPINKEKTGMQSLTITDLNLQLEAALEEENYEKAAQIRDEISRRG